MARRKSDSTGGVPSQPDPELPGPSPDDSPLPPEVEVPPRVPPEVPADMPPEVPADVPPEVPADVPPEVPADVPPEVPPEAPPEPAPQDRVTEARAAVGREERTGGRTFAARALVALLLLLAGAAIGIWAAPRLAPMLPSGLAPLAAWLSPASDDAEARIAELEARLDGAISDTQTRIAALPGSDELDRRIGAAVGDVSTRIEDEISTLRDSLDQLDTTAIRQRLDQLAGTLQGQGAELDTLKGQLEGGVAASSGQAEEVAARIDVYRAELQGMRAEVTALGSQTSALASRIDEVAATADRSIAAAQARVADVQAQASTAVDAAHTASDIAQLRAALAAGQPYAEVADRLAASPETALPEGLAAAAVAGAPTLATLQARFPEAAHEAIRASIMASAGDGFLARSGAFLNAQVASRSLTPQQGMSPDAVLSRMEDRLRNGDLAGALAEAENLPSEAAAAMSGWLASARLRLAAEAGLSDLTAASPPAN